MPVMGSWTVISERMIRETPSEGKNDEKESNEV